MTGAPVSEAPTRTLHFGDLAARLLRRWPTLVAGFLVTSALAVAAGSQVPTRYTATTTLVVSPIVSNPSTSASAQSTININTEREILGSNEVARLAAEQLGVPFTGSSALLTQTDVAAPSGSQVLQVSVSAGNPQDAARYSTAMATAYLEFRRQGAQQQAKAYIDAIDDQLQELTTSGDTSNVTLAALQDLRDQRLSLELVGSEPGRIVGQALPPTQPSSLGLTESLAAGVVGGLLVALSLALLRERLDRRVRFPSRLAEHTASQPTVVRGPEDAEAMRWLVRAIDLAVPQSTSPRLVGFAALGPVGSGLRDALAHALTTRDAPVVVDAASLTHAEVDGGWPAEGDLEAWSGRTALVDLTTVTSPTSFARLTAVCDVLLVAAWPAARLADVRRAWSVADEVGTGLLAAYVEPTRSSTRTPIWTPDAPAAADVEGSEHAGETPVAKSAEPASTGDVAGGAADGRAEEHEAETDAEPMSGGASDAPRTLWRPVSEVAALATKASTGRAPRRPHPSR